MSGTICTLILLECLVAQVKGKYIEFSFGEIGWPLSSKSAAPITALQRLTSNPQAGAPPHSASPDTCTPCVHCQSL